MERVLGLDLGTSSCGWALVDVPTTDGESGKVIALGTRVFPAGAEISGSISTTPGKERREKRTMRRQIARRAHRKVLLRGELTRLGLLPGDLVEYEQLMDKNPGELLKRAENDEQLSLRDIGRIIYWMSCRRGFLSLRKGGSSLIDEDDESDWQPSRFRLSQYNPTTGERVVTGQEEVLVNVLESQRRFYPEILTSQIIFGRRGRMTYPARPIRRDAFLGDGDGNYVDEFGIHGLVFFQRSVYWDKGTIGYCSLDPKSRKQRASRADRVSQEFIIRQLLINLKVGSDKRQLTDVERQRLFEVLMQQKTLAFSKVRSILSLSDDDKINFERQDDKGLSGNQVDPPLSKAVGATWATWSEMTKNNFVNLLIGSATEESIRTQLTKQFSLNDDQISAVLKVPLPSGRMSYSRKTILRLLPFMSSALTVKDVIQQAGFSSREDTPATSTVDLDSITNPLVKSSMRQLAKVLGDIDSRFKRNDGTTFDKVRIELARDVANSAKKRGEITKSQRRNKGDRDKAKVKIAEFAPGAEESSDSIRRQRLYDEQRNICVYCNKPISQVDVFSNKVQIDHILPRSQTLDNSMGNVVLVHSAENQEKGERTVFEWLGQEGVDQVVETAKRLDLREGKINKLRLEHVEPDHIPRSLLTTTGYITTLARDYLRDITGLSEKFIEVSRGRLTASLLYLTGLSKKDLVDDHRRHAQDAVMVALTSPKMAQNLAKRYKRERDFNKPRDDEYGTSEPWRGLRDDIKKHLSVMVTSHKPNRKNSGQFVEETNYGRVNSPYLKGNTVYARRRPLVSGFTQAQFAQIADPAIKQILIEDLKRRNIDVTTASKITFEPKDPPTFDGNAIKSVRCHANYPSHIILKPDTEPKTGVASGGNHIAYVYKNQSTNDYRMKVINRLDSYRVRNKPEKERQKDFIESGEVFVMSLCVTDTLEVLKDRVQSLYKVTSIGALPPVIYLAPINDSSGDNRWKVSINPLMSFSCKKIVVTPSGLVRRSNQ